MREFLEKAETDLGETSVEKVPLDSEHDILLVYVNSEIDQLKRPFPLLVESRGYPVGVLGNQITWNWAVG
jgi:hypothetical protein